MTAPALLVVPHAAARLAPGRSPWPGSAAAAVWGLLLGSPSAPGPTCSLGNGFYFALARRSPGRSSSAIQYLAGAGWWVVLRRVPEAMMAGAARWRPCCCSPLFFGRHAPLSWTPPGRRPGDPLLAGQGRLSQLALLLRCAWPSCSGLWVLFARPLRRASLAGRTGRWAGLAPPAAGAPLRALRAWSSR